MHAKGGKTLALIEPLGRIRRLPRDRPRILGGKLVEAGPDIRLGNHMLGHPERYVHGRPRSLPHFWSAAFCMHRPRRCEHLCPQAGQVGVDRLEKLDHSVLGYNGIIYSREKGRRLLPSAGPSWQASGLCRQRLRLLLRFLLLLRLAFPHEAVHDEPADRD
jgi:hypothetical protein